MLTEDIVTPETEKSNEASSDLSTQSFLDGIEKVLPNLADEVLRRQINEYLRIKDDSEDVTSYKTRLQLVKKILKNLYIHEDFSKSPRNAMQAKWLSIGLLAREVFYNIKTHSDIEDLLLAFPDLINQPQAKKTFFKKKEKQELWELEKILDDLRRMVRIECIRANTQRKIEGKGWKYKSTEKAINDPKRALAYLIPIAHGFPEVELANKDEVIDTNRPTVMVIQLGREALSRARAIDKTNEVNVIIPTKSMIRLDGLIVVDEVLVYKNGKLYLVASKGKIKPNYVVGSDNGWEKTSQNAPFSGSGMGERLTHFKQGMIIANYSGTKRTHIPMPCNVNKPHKRGRKDPKPRHPRINDVKDENYTGESLLQKHMNEIAGIFLRNSNLKKCVLKPKQGTCGGFGVWIIDRADVLGDKESFMTTCEKLAAYMENVKDALIEPFVEPYSITVNGKSVDWNIRVYVTRTPDGKLTTEQGKIVRYGAKDLAVNITNGSSVIDLEELRSQIPGFDKLLRHIDKVSIMQIENVERFGRKMAKESKEKVTPGENDLYGIDIIVTKKDGKPIPVIIEIGGASAGCLWSAEQETDPAAWGKFSEKFTQRVITQAKEHFKTDSVWKKISSIAETVGKAVVAQIPSLY